MEIGIAGSTGLVGSELVKALKNKGHKVRRLVRSENEVGTENVLWSPRQGVRELHRLEGIDGLVNLAGENIASGRWTRSRKKEIYRSRVESTRLLVDRVGRLQKKPSVFVNASAIGYYGGRSDEILDEKSSPGEGFLTDVCLAWESEARRARDKGMRAVFTRFGVILSAKGGALAKMLPIFRLGAGGRLGSGKQWMSWIAISDAVGAIIYTLENSELQGPVNVVSPNPVQNETFTKTLGRVLGRPAIFPAPAFALKLALGQMAQELLLASQRVVPRELERTSFQFSYPELEPALREVLKPAT
ncbi:MAG TPA: TIGR01777 family oxidoreductase [Acidobacteriota bacterium]|nr:TIGR01777 family oxidoreductase [Acidobacteriota bacterium]